AAVEGGEDRWRGVAQGRDSRLYVHLEEFVVMPNHVHGIVILDDDAVGETSHRLVSTGLDKQDREFFIENLLAAASPEYLRSVQEAREDYNSGRTVSLEEAFGGESPA
ncbi:MAG: hypothetical protein Q7R39_02745, partial [Dehalococcoidia bacterium]|nr:hypothetical protein [Dehalococcoidia bacterium]